MELDIRTIPIGKIIAAPYNPRVDLRPGDPEYEKLERSLEEFGCVEPLVWNRRSGHLVGGHQRLKVLIARGETRAAVSVVDLSPEKERALNLALNRISGSWDEAKLAAVLEELIALPDFDLEITGFDLDEARQVIAACAADEARAETFDAEAEMAAERPIITKPGEIIELGAHRLLCGDSTDAGQVRRLVEAGGGVRAVLFATDPPYCVGYDGTNHPQGRPAPVRGTGRPAPVRGTGRPAPVPGDPAADRRSGPRAPARRGAPARGGAGRSTKNKDWSGSYGLTWDDAQENEPLYDGFVSAAVAEAIRPDAAWYCWHASRRQAMVERVWERHGAFVHAQIIWAKNRPVLTRTWYAWQHEPCFFGWVRPPAGSRPPRRSREVLSTVWSIDTIASGPERPEHPTPKPLAVFEIPMAQHTLPGEVCYEPFAGSGTQVIAAERLGRRCLAVEISPRYCDVIVRRYIAYAGTGAVDARLAARYAVRGGPARRTVVMAGAGARVGSGVGVGADGGAKAVGTVESRPPVAGPANGVEAPGPRTAGPAKGAGAVKAAARARPARASTPRARSGARR